MANKRVWYAWHEVPAGSGRRAVPLLNGKSLREFNDDGRALGALKPLGGEVDGKPVVGRSAMPVDDTNRESVERALLAGQIPA